MAQSGDLLGHAKSIANSVPLCCAVSLIVQKARKGATPVAVECPSGNQLHQLEAAVHNVPNF
jgi:hypothetical protein